MPITRRTMLTTAPAAAAATLGGAAMAQTQPPATTPTAGATQQAPGFYRYKVGDIEVTAVSDGHAMRPPENFIRNAELTDVQKALAEGFLPTNALQNQFTPLVLRTGGRTVVIDTGNGNMGAPTTGAFLTNFRAAGFDPAQVNTVLISHFHGDHINGLRLRDGTAVYPNAEVIVPAAEWAFWMDDARMNQAPDAMKAAFQNVRRVFGPMVQQVKQFEHGREVVSGVTAVAAVGHTPGHTAFAITSGQGRLMTVVDAINHPALFVRNPDWVPVFDMNPDQARETRRRLLEMAASERMQLAFYHAPFPATGHVAKEGNGFRYVPVSWSPVV